MDDNSKIMELAYEAGAILLENGAEISRVDETMRRIAGHYGVDDESFFVLSNGIMATARGFARTKFIPIKGTSLDKVVAVNQLSRKVSEGKCDLGQLESQLKAIRAMRPKPAWEQITASAFGSAAFCIIFGGGFADSIAAFVAGLLLWVYMLFVGYRHLSRIAGTITGGLLATVLCGVMYKLGLGTHLSNMIIGAVVPLIPGVPFTNGIRDIANEDYIAGITRLLDALLVFFCIAMGVALAFLLDETVAGKMQLMENLAAAPETAGMFVQLIAAYVGTLAFAILFGVPRKYYLDSGLCGMLGWLLYLILFRHAGMSAAIATLISTIFIGILSRVFAVVEKCPAAVFLLCGIFPLVPGAGVFWSTYYLISNQFELSSTAGFTAGKIAIAIVLGIILAMELPQRFFSGRKRLSH